jgi:hypothetical protein
VYPTTSPGDEHDDVGVGELRAEEGAVAVLGARRGGHEALRIEVVVQPHEQCAEPADGAHVGARGGTDGQS